MGRARRLGGGIVGGYGPRSKAGDTTPTGRGRKAPSLSLAAAAAIKGALLERGARAGLKSLTAYLKRGNRRLPFFLRQRYLTWETPLSANATS